MSGNRVRLSISDMKTWVNTSIASSGFQVKNLKDSFQNGQAFSALLYSYRPDLIDYPSMTFTPENALSNNNKAFKAALNAGIQPLLDAEDIVNYQDEKSIFTYLTGFYSAFASSPISPRPISTSQSPSPSPRNPVNRVQTAPKAGLSSSADSDNRSERTPSRALPQVPVKEASTNTQQPAQDKEIKDLKLQIEKLKEQLKEMEGKAGEERKKVAAEKEEWEKKKQAQGEKEKKEKGEFEKFRSEEKVRIQQEKAGVEKLKVAEKQKLDKERESYEKAKKSEREAFLKEKNQHERELKAEKDKISKERSEIEILRNELKMRDQLNSGGKLDSSLTELVTKNAELTQKLSQLKETSLELAQKLDKQKAENEELKKKFNAVMGFNIQSFIKDMVSKRYEEEQSRIQLEDENKLKESSFLHSQINQFQDTIENALDRIRNCESKVTHLSKELLTTETEWIEREKNNKDSFCNLIQNQLVEIQKQITEEKAILEKQLIVIGSERRGQVEKVGNDKEEIEKGKREKELREEQERERLREQKEKEQREKEQREEEQREKEQKDKREKEQREKEQKDKELREKEQREKEQREKEQREKEQREKDQREQKERDQKEKEQKEKEQRELKEKEQREKKDKEQKEKEQREKEQRDRKEREQKEKEQKEKELKEKRDKEQREKELKDKELKEQKEKEQREKEKAQKEKEQREKEQRNQSFWERG
eukprot:TRINITY_DN4152_c0_g3_i1.p1 TRINITY_DN4152_c0_g3~~TRINITY_DN4152_c0_g3_i1.p1  ORF type:complete len:711 (-),score=341.70 TRINITY_DN4152_c0_g3_i1:182-2314(-)